MKEQEWSALEPQALFHWFEAVCRVPRGSYHEEKIAAFLMAFAAERGLSREEDDLHNVLISAPGTPGREGEQPVLLQGHTDMVCEKNADVTHDFETEGIDVLRDGDWLRARGTTLGGDDGIAAAAMLALLDGAAESHPPLECLFTVQEEVGLNGAAAFDYSRIRARRMINLDSEKLDEMIAGCAGGVRTDAALDCGLEEADGAALRVAVSGLCGGHSGENIASGRANANKLLARILLRCLGRDAYRLASLSGGAKDNAIPREADALLCTDDPEAFARAAQAEAALIAGELGGEDKNFSLSVEPAELPARVFTEGWTRRTVTFAACVPNGVFEMSRDVPGLVGFSRNLGVVRTENGRVTFTFSARSALESQLDWSQSELEALAALCGGTAKHRSRYPGWAYRQISPLRDAYAAAFRRVTGREPQTAVIHAGLECGLISARVPDMDIISVGPDMADIHSPGERLHIPSCGVFWRVLKELLAQK